MRKTVYLSKCSPFLLLFLHSQRFEFPSSVIALFTNYYHMNKKAQTLRKERASHSCCWGHTSSAQRQGLPPWSSGHLPQRDPEGLGVGRRQATNRESPPSLCPTRALLPHPRTGNRALLWGSFCLHRQVQVCLLGAQARRHRGGKNGKLTARLVVPRVLLFVHDPPVLLSFLRQLLPHWVQALELHSVGDRVG